MRHPGGQIFAVLLIFTTGSAVKADWIKGIFSSRAKIDSLNRFLVIQDPDQHKYFGAQVLSLGDINGDKSTDLLICRYEGSSLDTNWAFLYYGGPNATGTPAKRFSGFFPNMGVIGDVNGDGYVDLGRTHLPALGSFNFDVYFGGPNFGDVPDFVIPQHWSQVVRAAPFDGTGKLLLPLGRSVNGGLVDFYRIDNGRDTIPQYTLPDTSQNFGNQFAVGDFNGDGYPDLAVGASNFLDSGWVKFYWGGPGFDTVPDFQIHSKRAQFSRILLNVGDFNGDGADDILICGGDDSACGIYYGGPHLHTKPDVIVNTMRGGFGYFPPTSAAAIGDFNHDGHPDFMLSYVNETTGQFSIHIFLGGPTSDSVIVGDLYITDNMVPGGPWRFGVVVAGIGDFDGDGIDDIAVTSQTDYGLVPWWGQVSIIRGYNSQPTDVPITNDDNLPASFTLHPAYPNPFNPSATISFDLPKRETAKLTVFDITGRVVQRLLDVQLAAGPHRVTWDGRNQAGQLVASGVYLFRLSTPDYQQTVKGTLLK